MVQLLWHAGPRFKSTVLFITSSPDPPHTHTRGQRRGAKRTRDTSPPAATGCVSVSCACVRRANSPPGPQAPADVARHPQLDRAEVNAASPILTPPRHPLHSLLPPIILSSACSTSKHHRIRERVGAEEEGIPCLRPSLEQILGEPAWSCCGYGRKAS